MFWCRGRLQREKQLSLLKTLTLPTFSKLAATLPKKIFGSQNHFWQLAQAELVEFIPDTKSLAAKTNFGRILPKIFGTANFYFDFFSAFHFVLQRVTFKLNKRQHTRTTHHTTTQHPLTSDDFDRGRRRRTSRSRMARGSPPRPSSSRLRRRLCGGRNRTGDGGRSLFRRLRRRRCSSSRIVAGYRRRRTRRR